ncbi:hypothetical protein L0337_13755 [candidate division KSB1 bacterium]|nr:hypothetical protein [candidate division KSB1 bacterium]
MNIDSPNANGGGKGMNFIPRQFQRFIFDQTLSCPRSRSAWRCVVAEGWTTWDRMELMQQLDVSTQMTPSHKSNTACETVKVRKTR